jgi:hypothetical protein
MDLPSGFRPTRFTFFIDKPLCRGKPGQDFNLLERQVDVELRNTEKDLWAVCCHSNSVVCADLSTEVESMPSWRTDDFINRTRFPLPDALALAEKFINSHREFVVQFKDGAAV